MTALGEEETGHEDSENWSFDLIDLNILDDNDSDTFTAFIELLEKNIQKEIEYLSKVRTAEAGVLPYFSGANTTVELRTVLKREYKWGENIDEFVPSIQTLTPVISVAIKVDSGSSKSFTFQTSPKDVQYLIDELRSALKIASAIENNVALKDG